MLGPFFFLSDSAGPLEWASFLRLLVLKGQQFKHLDYRRNVFHFPFKRITNSALITEAQLVRTFWKYVSQIRKQY